jgi:hypothetical protein
MIKTSHALGRYSERRIRNNRRVVATFAAIVVALVVGAVASPDAHAAPHQQLPSLVPLLGQPSTTQAVPPGYSVADQVQCWFDRAIVSIYGGPDHRYVSAELTYSDAGPYPDKGMLRARSSVWGPWEHFTVCYDYADETYSIYSPAAQAWVSTEIHYPDNREGMLRARADIPGPWEKFDISLLSTGNVSIFSPAKIRYVSAELAYSNPLQTGMLRARNKTVGPWEEFGIYPII